MKRLVHAAGSIVRFIARLRSLLAMPTSTEEVDLQSELEDEEERDLENELKSELECIKEKLLATKIALSGARSNNNFKKMASKEPILSLMIPNNLFSLWKKRRDIEERLLQKKSSLTEMANVSLNKVIKLDTDADDLEARLQNECYRFLASYKKAAGRRRYKLLIKETNIMLLKDEVVPNVSLHAAIATVYE